MITLDNLFDFLEDDLFLLKPLQKDLLKRYHHIINSYRGRINMISRRDVDHLAERHFLTCLSLCRELQSYNFSRILDIGSGAGFPGIIIQIIFPDIEMVLLESIRKKAILLNNTCKQLNLSAQVVCERAEYYSAHSTKNFDIVVARAVSVMDHLWRWSTTVLKPSGYLMAMKGGDCTREFEWLKKQNLDFRQITTPDSWRSFSSYLETKYIIAVKKADNMRR